MQALRNWKIRTKLFLSFAVLLAAIVAVAIVGIIGVDTYIIVIISVAAILLGIITAFVISALISKPIERAVSSLQDMAQGKLNVNISVDSKDEVGQLSAAALELTTILQTLMDDMDHMARDQRNGLLDSFIDKNKFENAFAEVAEKINGMIETEIALQRKAIEVFSRIADGEFDVDLEKQPGQLIFVNEAVDGMRDNIKHVSDAIDSVIQAASVNGDLAFKIDTHGFHDGWLEIMEGLNRVCESVDKPIVEIRDVMGRLIEGDFTVRVKGSYTGDFGAIADAVNGTIDALNGYISEMSSILSNVASGDLTQTITREYVGSFSEIKDSINHICGTLFKTMGEISSASSQVLAGAKQISQSAMDLANGAQTQASNVQELNASIDLISQQTRNNAENAEYATELSNKSTVSAQEGNAAMNQMLDAMTAIRESSTSISQIIKVIEGIAFQTNLLSLNAAVEAARAGDAGKGFGVVADEVRILANKSQNSAAETTEQIQNSINRVEAGSEIAQATAASLDAIVSSAAEVMDIISGISSASRDQADAIEQIAAGLQQISGIVQSNSAVSEETAAAAQELNSQAEILQELVSYFKL
ncbi:MAG: methyl-accepting chemotaxis protein [Defluviitaleaceae bacterium]|nr:methyl-accepting chemotaxis protein [Defluviitaleaceae bacterium]